MLFAVHILYKEGIQGIQWWAWTLQKSCYLGVLVESQEKGCSFKRFCD